MTGFIAGSMWLVLVLLGDRFTPVTVLRLFGADGTDVTAKSH